MEMTAHDLNHDESDCNCNLNKLERLMSVGIGGGLLCLALGRRTTLPKLILAGAGAAIAYRGVTGHCRVYDILGINTSHSVTDESSPSDDDTEVESTPHQLAPKNQVDKERFDKLKDTQIDRGRDEKEAVEIAAEEVKELRRREGRSKDANDGLAQEYDEKAERF